MTASTVGIVGGGQLGRMLALAGADLGLDVGILDPDPDAPGARVAAFNVVGGYGDPDALAQLARRCDVVTYEFENVPPAALEGLSVPVRPPVRALEVGQDRLDEKRFLRSLGIETAPFEAVERDPRTIEAALHRLGGRGILKTRRLGYDGKGQVRLPETAPARALAAVGDGDLILEGYVAFDAELSVIAVRALDGAVRSYDPARNVHRDGILHTSTVPSGLSEPVERAAHEATERLLNALDYVGTIGVEFFVTGENLLANEFAPRVHNSGHWTDGACLHSQFENHMRAVAGMAVGSTTRLADATMTNIVGSLPRPELDGSVRTVSYGKREARAGRKMGHTVRLDPRERR